MDNYNIITNRAIDYIEENIFEVINLKDIADALKISKYHFHKIFKSVTGETVAGFIRRIRLEKSADMLIRTDNSMITIAVETGFSSSSVFSREFKKKYSISPRDFRLLFSYSKKVNQNSFQNFNSIKKNRSIELTAANNYSFSNIMRISKQLSKNYPMPFKIETLPEYSIVYMRYFGEYSDIHNIFSLWLKLKEFSVRNLITHNDSSFFSIIYDNPNICDYGKCRYDACITVPKSKNINFFKNKIGHRTISGGKYAVFNFKGNINNLFQAYTWIDKFWFSEMGYEPDNKPSYFRHPNFKHSSESMELDICIPIKKI